MSYSLTWGLTKMPSLDLAHLLKTDTEILQISGESGSTPSFMQSLTVFILQLWYRSATTLLEIILVASPNKQQSWMHHKNGLSPLHQAERGHYHEWPNEKVVGSASAPLHFAPQT